MDPLDRIKGGAGHPDRGDANPVALPPLASESRWIARSAAHGSRALGGLEAMTVVVSVAPRVVATLPSVQFLGMHRGQ